MYTFLSKVFKNYLNYVKRGYIDMYDQYIVISITYTILKTSIIVGSE